MGNYYTSFDSGRTFHRYFTALRGVDLSSDPSEVSRSHFAFVENMWCDPVATDGVATETFPGYRTFARFGGPIYGIFRHRVLGEDYLVVHAGERLYRFAERLRNYESTLALLAPYDITLKQERGCAFSFGETLCLLIGGEYLCIDKEGVLHSLLADDSLAYVPTTYYNGEPYEQRNLLTDKVQLLFSADGDYECAVETDGLLFSVFNEEEKTCEVRISQKHRLSGKVVIPPTVQIGTQIYTVKAISQAGFAGMPGLISVTIPETVSIIGARAFYGDTALLTLSLPNALQSIGVEAFFGCMSLRRLYLGSSPLWLIGEDAFHYCDALQELRFGGTEEAFAAIQMEGESTLRDLALTPLFESDPYESFGALYRYPLHERCLSLQGVFLGELALSENFLPLGDVIIRYAPVYDGDYITHIELSVSEESFLASKTLKVIATTSPTYFSLPTGAVSFGAEGKEAICGCRAVGKFDGRIFFTGNESFPNTVFYTGLDDTGIANPFYIGCLNYFNDGTGFIPNRGFLVTGGLLAVLKADAGGEGEIFFHTAANGKSDLLPRIYPSVAAVPGVGLAGCTLNYGDEAIFLGKNGLFAVEKGNYDNERALYPRSSAVNLHLLRERTDLAQMAVFEGMLYLLTEGEIYLADSRRRTTHTGGSREYEWYRLSGIGSFAADTPVYRYSAYLPTAAEELALQIHPTVGEVAQGTVYSATLTSGEKIYYVKNKDGHFPVDTDGERTGGCFSPASTLCATDTALYFGTEEGAIGCFNTDKRGLALYRPLQSSLYISEENGTYLPLNSVISSLFSEDMIETLPLYEKQGEQFLASGSGSVYRDGARATLVTPLGEQVAPGRVHRYYYSFGGHAFRACCALAMDDGGIPHYAKDTVPRSPTVKIKTPPGSDLSVYVRTDRHPFVLCDRLCATAADAGDTDFSAFDFHSEEAASLSLRERERAWCYKQYLFVSEKFRAPFGIFSLTYSFRPCGRIKP